MKKSFTKWAINRLDGGTERVLVEINGREHRLNGATVTVRRWRDGDGRVPSTKRDNYTETTAPWCIYLNDKLVWGGYATQREAIEAYERDVAGVTAA